MDRIDMAQFPDDDEEKTFKFDVSLMEKYAKLRLVLFSQMFRNPTFYIIQLHDSVIFNGKSYKNFYLLAPYPIDVDSLFKRKDIEFHAELGVMKKFAEHGLNILVLSIGVVFAAPHRMKKVD